MLGLCYAIDGRWRTITLECYRVTNIFFNKVLEKNNQQRRSLDYVHKRTSSLHQSISAHTQMGLCRWGKETTPCVLQAWRVVFPLAQVDLEHQQRHVANGGCPRHRQVRVGRVLCLANAQSRLREELQGSHSRRHHYPISSFRGEARRVCQWIDGHSSTTTSTPMIRVACSADSCA